MATIALRRRPFRGVTRPGGTVARQRTAGPQRGFAALVGLFLTAILATAAFLPGSDLPGTARDAASGGVTDGWAQAQAAQTGDLVALLDPAQNPALADVVSRDRLAFLASASPQPPIEAGTSVRYPQASFAAPTGGSGGAGGGAPAGGPAPGGAAVGGLEGAMLAAVNNQRVAAGLPPLIPSGSLVAVGRARAANMVNLGYFGHYSPDGSNVFSTLAAYGVGYTWAGENLARNNYDAGSAVGVAIADLMASGSHAANILSPSFRYIGVGYAYGNGFHYFAIIFTG